MKWWFRCLVSCVAIFICAVDGSVSAQEMSLRPNSEKHRIRTEMGVGVTGAYTGIYGVTTNNVGLRPRVGIGAKLDFAVVLAKHFAIGAEVAYGGGSVDVARGGFERRVRTNSIDIPIMLSLHLFDHKVRISVGPQFCVMSKAEYTKDGEKMLFGPIYPTYNLAAEVGVRLGKYFVLKARYVHPLQTTLNQFEGEEFSMRAYRISLGVGLMF